MTCAPATRSNARSGKNPTGLLAKRRRETRPIATEERAANRRMGVATSSAKDTPPIWMYEKWTNEAEKNHYNKSNRVRQSDAIFGVIVLVMKALL